MIKLLLTCDKCGKEISGPYKSVKECKTPFMTVCTIDKKPIETMDICLECWNLFLSLKAVPVYTGKVKE